MPSCMKRYCQRQTQVLAGLVHDLIGAEPVCAQQDDLSPPHLLLRHIAIPHDASKRKRSDGVTMMKIGACARFACKWLLGNRSGCSNVRFDPRAIVMSRPRWRPFLWGTTVG